MNILQAANAEVRSAAALRDAGLDAQQARSALRPPPLRVVTTEPVDADADERGGFAFFAVLLLYGQLIGIGYFVAMGVVEEKSSRVVELLLSTLKPKHLLAGKILGLGLLGLGQLLLLAVLGLAVAAAGGALDVDGDILIAAGLALVWFVVGYAFYAAAFATAASLVSRQEDLQSVITPLTLVLLVGFFMSFGVVSDPDGTLAKVSSFIPPIAPLTMPPRIALGEASAVEIVGAFAVTIGATLLLIPLAARIYSGAVLRMGGTIKLRDAWRAARRACTAVAQTSVPWGGRSSPVPAITSSSTRTRCPRTRSAISSRIRRAPSIPLVACVSCDLIRRTSSIAASARSTSVRSPPASSPSPPASAISVRARASE